jgi:hypothetical protein
MAQGGRGVFAATINSEFKAASGPTALGVGVVLVYARSFSQKCHPGADAGADPAFYRQGLMAADTHFGLDPDRPGWVGQGSAPVSRADRLLTGCAWCERVKVGDGWVSAEIAIRTLRTFEWPEPPLFTHGMCERCFAFLTESKRPADLASPGENA